MKRKMMVANEVETSNKAIECKLEPDKGGVVIRRSLNLSRDQAVPPSEGGEFFNTTYGSNLPRFAKFDQTAFDLSTEHLLRGLNKGTDDEQRKKLYPDNQPEVY